MTSSLIELFPCCVKSASNTTIINQYIAGSISSVNNTVPIAMRLNMETTLQTYPSSFPRRLSQYLHRCPILLGGTCCVGSYTYTVSSFDFFSILIK